MWFPMVLGCQLGLGGPLLTLPPQRMGRERPASALWPRWLPASVISTHSSPAPPEPPPEGLCTRRPAASCPAKSHHQPHHHAEEHTRVLLHFQGHQTTFCCHRGGFKWATAH